MKLINFPVKEFMAANSSERASIYNKYVLNEFFLEFKIEGIKTIDQFNLVISQDRKVRNWYKHIKIAYDEFLRLPQYTILEDVPDECKDLILKEQDKLNKLYSELERDTIKCVNDYREKMLIIEEKRKAQLKTFSLYTLVATLSIDDVPLEMKTALFLETDKDIVTLFRKDVVKEYKKKCFKNLIENGGKFSKDFNNPFDLK